MKASVCSANSLARLRPGILVNQVTTHTHDRAELPFYGRFSQIGHADSKSIPAGGSWEFPVLEGPGTITTIWMTFAGRWSEILWRKRLPIHRYLWILIYYDGHDRPAVEAPAGHFFCNGTTRAAKVAGKFVGATAGGYYCFLPMPFRKSCRVVVENRHPNRAVPTFYGSVACEKYSEFSDDVGYLHTQYNERSFTKSGSVEGDRLPDDPHLMLQADSGPGHYVGSTLTIYPTHWLRSRFSFPYFFFPYLEGNLKVYIDEEFTAPGAGRISKPIGAPQG